MEMPQPGEAHAKLARFVGKWSIAETMHPSPWDAAGGTADGECEYRLGCDGFFLICDYAQLRGGKATFRGHGVYGFDTKTNAYTMHWFDSMGMDPGAPAKGTWTGDTLVFQHPHSRYTYRWESDDRYTFQLESSRDGETWSTFLDSVYTRVS